MPFERIRTFVQTVRFRLTLWSTAVVFLLLLINIVAIRHGLEATRSQMVDEFIEEELHAAVLDLDHLGDQPDRLHEQFNRQATGHPRRRLFIQLIDAQGALVWSSEQSPSADVLPVGVLPEQEPETVADHRILTQTVLRPGRPELTVRVGCSLERAHQELARFTSTLLVVGIVLLLIAPVGGYLLAGRATRPIARIISTTARLDASHLDERLPLRGTHDELDRLSQTINRFLDRIAAYLRQSREFTANAAHELRSPLTALQSSLEITLNTDRSIDEYKEVLAVLLEECGQMRVLVNQLLLLAEEDAGRLQLHSQALRLDQIVANSLEMFQVVAESAGVELSARRLEPAMLRGDGNRLWQVVNNLLDNAIKFTPAGGRIALDLRLDDARRQGVLEVSDTGTGIDPHDLPHIFERFYQGDKARQRETISRGLGLGLSICQAVIAAHGGVIEVASAPGRGTTFTIQLPDCTRPGPSDPHAVPPPTWQSSDGKPVAESA